MQGTQVGTSLLLVALTLEVTLTVLRLLVKTPDPRLVLLVRAGELTLFSGLAAAGLIDWGVRYHAFAACLVALVVVEALRWTLHVRRPARRRRRSPALIVATGAATTVVTLLAGVPLLLFPQGARPLTPTGAGVLTHAVVTLTDSGRQDPYRPAGTGRTVTVGVWYRVDAPGEPRTKRPLVVFSHGGLGVLASNESLYLELASHGYVVAAIGHTYQALYVREASGAWRWLDLGYLRDLLKEDARSDPVGSLALYREWLALRTSDIEFVIAALSGAGDPTTAFPEGLAAARELVDAGRVGVAGHSLGGAAALAVGRSRDDVKAVLALEAPMLGDLAGVQDGRFLLTEEPYPVPVLNVYSDDTWTRLADLPQYAGNVRLLAGGGAAVNYHVAGANHLGLTDLALTSPRLAQWLSAGRQTAPASQVLAEIGQVARAFFDAALGENGVSARPALP